MGRSQDGEGADTGTAGDRGVAAGFTPGSRTAEETSAGPPLAAVSDEVDRLVREWHAQRPDLDVRPLEVLSRIWRLARHLDRARASAFAGPGLEPWEFDVLSALRREGPPHQLSPGRLLQDTMVTSGTMTNRIDRLEAADLVRRRPDPQDKRGVLVTLTDEGRERADAALDALLSKEQALLTGLNAEQRRTLADLLRTLLAPFDAGPAGAGSAEAAAAGEVSPGAGPAGAGPGRPAEP